VGVKVALGVPATVDVPAGAKKVGVSFTIGIASNGTGKARVVMQGFVNCAQLPAIPATCVTKQCKFLRRQLAAKCGNPGAGTTLAFEPRPGSGQILVTGTFDRQFGRRTSSAQGTLRLNKLGRELLMQNRTLSLQTNTVVRDRSGQSLGTLIRTLLRLR
jgi:hypothetical protein